MSESPRELRFGSAARGTAIGIIVLVYGWRVQQSQGAFIEGLLLAAALQAGVLILRRFSPGALVPQATFILELLADAVTVLLFALGVYGAIARPLAEL